MCTHDTERDTLTHRERLRYESSEYCSNRKWHLVLEWTILNRNIEYLREDLYCFICSFDNLSPYLNKGNQIIPRPWRAVMPVRLKSPFKPPLACHSYHINLTWKTIIFATVVQNGGQGATINYSQRSEDYDSPKIFDPDHGQFEIKLQKSAFFQINCSRKKVLLD